jgi:hypothetical protein
VDDVIMWRQVGDAMEFGIGIADVAAWIPEGCEADAYAEQLGQSLYIDGVPIRPMLPFAFSSLRSDGVTRPVLARMYTIRGGVLDKDQANRKWTVFFWNTIVVFPSHDHNLSLRSVLKELHIFRQVPHQIIILPNPSFGIHSNYECRFH